MIVHVVVTMFGGIVDNVSVFRSEVEALEHRRVTRQGLDITPENEDARDGQGTSVRIYECDTLTRQG